MNVASMARAIIIIGMGMGMGMTRIIIQMAASWGLGRMGCGSVGRISSKRDGSGSSHLSLPMDLFLLSGIFLGGGFLLSHPGYIRHKFFSKVS